MNYILIAIILSFVLWMYVKIASCFHIIDIPNARSSHSRITLNGGGLIFYVGVLLGFLIFDYEYFYFLIGLTLVAVVSFADDIRPVSRLLRLLIHFVAVAFLFMQLKMYDVSWYTFIFFSLVYVGFINIYNFMDGINGLTVGYSSVVVGSFWYINNYFCPFIDNSWLYIIAVALLVFSPFNFRKKAVCFAGDVGAVSMAFMLLFLLVKLILQTADFSYFVLFAVYGVDGGLTIIHRIGLKENILKPHRKHAYQIMANELGVPHVKVSLLYMLLQGMIFMGYIGLRSYKYWYLGGIVLVLCGLYLWLIRRYYYPYHRPDSNKEDLSVFDQ